VTIKETARKYRRVIMLAVLVMLGIVGAFYWVAGREAPPAYREVAATRGDLEVTIPAREWCSPEPSGNKATGRRPRR
jgi:hypothetical protein